MVSSSLLGGSIDRHSTLLGAKGKRIFKLQEALLCFLLYTAISVRWVFFFLCFSLSFHNLSKYMSLPMNIVFFPHQLITIPLGQQPMQN